MIRHHFPNVPDLAERSSALVSTCRDGSPLVAAPAHTIQAALTPAAAAALLDHLSGQDLPDELIDLSVGLRAAAQHALLENWPKCSP